MQLAKQPCLVLIWKGNKMKLYGIVGAGGFGREVMPLAKAMLNNFSESEKFELVFVDEKKDALCINQHKVMTIEEFFLHPAPQKFFNVTIANYVYRRKMVEIMLMRGALPFRINALNSVELDGNQIAEGAIFCGFTTVTSNTSIGKYFHANIYSYIAHDCVIGDFVTFAPNVQCNGGVIIEDDVYIGTGVIIRQGTLDKPIVIGKGAVLGMGAVVTKSVPAFETVIGNPAKPLKQLSKQ